VLGLPIRLALLKGRSNYLCLHRLEQARHDEASAGAGASRTLAKLEVWAQATRTGDLAELPGLDERSPMIPLVTSTRDNCLGASCPKFRSCHVNLARREALAADVVVINHHLFFADLAVRESGMAELLPTVRTVIFDEAHQLNETGVQFLGRHLSTGQLLDFVRDLLACGLQLARGLADWSVCASGLERATRDLRLCAGKTYPGAKLRWTAEAPEQIEPQIWHDALDHVAQALEAARQALETVSEIAPDFIRLLERAKGLSETLNSFGKPAEVGSVRWLDVGTQLRLVESPLDIAQSVQDKLLKPAEHVGPAGPQKSWIFTSATLGDESGLKWFTEPCGLNDAKILRVKSPFDYPHQAAIFVPKNLPKPAAPNHSQAVAAMVAQYAQIIGGRTLVLTTTLRALRTISESLQQTLSGVSTIEVLAQGQMPKRELMERFRQGANDAHAGHILVASASFWEGIDIPGDALQMLVIDKLPFPPPNDPLVEARSSRLELTGRSPFSDYFMPEAAVALKQGAGRLIRRETDRGVLIVCDSRLSSMGYGRRLMAALPPMKLLQTEAELLQTLEQITRASTTDHFST
jgi:ATP-dependent DNA helicase DinG